MKIKFISFLLIIAVFVTMFTTSCFADFEFTYNDTNYSFPDYPEAVNNYSYFYMCDYSSANSDGSVYYNFVLYCSNSPFVVGQSYTGQSFSYFYDEWHSGPSNQVFAFPSSSVNKIIYSNENITDSSSNVVFQRASQPIVETQGTLAPIVENQETNKVMEEILGILPVVIVVLVSLIAIRKAIVFLRILLHQS